jgi:hypothetical protein
VTAWEFDVAVSTHNWLKRGVTVLDYRRVTVASPSYLDASLCALQMASGPDDAVVTDILWRY